MTYHLGLLGFWVCLSSSVLKCTENYTVFWKLDIFASSVRNGGEACTEMDEQDRHFVGLWN